MLHKRWRLRRTTRARNRMHLKVLQCNLNHARRAQDLCIQTMGERDYAMGIVAEPYAPGIPSGHPCWAINNIGSVAIHWRHREGRPPCNKAGEGEAFVAVEWGPITVVGIYIPPSLDLATNEEALDEIADYVRDKRHRPMILAGDFNAKSTRWGSRATDGRGRVLEAWAAALDLCLLNTGSRSTLIRPQGESIVDLTWSTPSVANKIKNWRVSEQETLSDHLYIEFDVEVTRQLVLNRGQGWEDPRRLPRWALKKLDPDRLTAAVSSALWPGNRIPEEDVPEQVNWLRGMMTDACDFAMPRAKSSPRRKTYWWTKEIADLRKTSVHARRLFTRCRRRGDDEETADALERYREVRKALSAAIRRSKTAAWNEQLHALNADPWGRPYKLVMNRLKPWAPPATETMSPRLLTETVNKLFPVSPTPPIPEEPVDWDPELGVTGREMAGIFKRLRQRGNKAPGLDGIPGRIWGLVEGQMSGYLRRLFDNCYRDGKFPEEWESAQLVLIPKGGRPEGAPPAYRPICLLDEAGKLREVYSDPPRRAFVPGRSGPP